MSMEREPGPVEAGNDLEYDAFLAIVAEIAPIANHPADVLRRLAPTLAAFFRADALLFFSSAETGLVPGLAWPEESSEELAGWALNQQGPVCLAHFSQTIISGCGNNCSPAGTFFPSYAMAPLSHRGKPGGVIGAMRRKIVPFTVAEKKFLAALAGSVSQALWNHRRYLEMAEAKIEWEETFKAVQDTLVVVDDRCRILRANRDTPALSARGMAGKGCCEVFDFCGEARGRCPAAQAIATGREVVVEVLRPDIERALYVSAFPVHGESGGAVKAVLSVRDETLRRRIETQLAHSAKLAAIGEMAAGVAHELNSPLTAILGNASLILRRLPEGDKSQRMVADIKNCGQRCKKIIGNLLTFARQENYSFEPLSVNEVIQSSFDLLGFQLEKAGVRLERDTGQGLPPILGNKQEVEQVLVNLLMNALHAVAESDVKVVRVSSYLDEPEDGSLGVAVSVQDTGVGMPPERLEKVFNPFFTTKEEEKGTGLGLSVSMGIAKAHGGMIRAQSRAGEGSIFTLLLPLMEQRVPIDLTDDPAEEPREGQGPESLDKLKPELKLARKLGLLAGQLAEGMLASVVIERKGSTPTWGAGLLTAAVLDGLLAGDDPSRTDLMEARRVTRERGIIVTETASGSSDEYGFSLTVRLEGSGDSIAATGTLIGRREPRLVALGGLHVEAPLQGDLLLFWAADRPGLVGDIAAVLATSSVDIRQMRSSAGTAATAALAVFQIDGAVGAELLAQMRNQPGLARVARVRL